MKKRESVDHGDVPVDASIEREPEKVRRGRDMIMVGQEVVFSPEELDARYIAIMHLRDLYLEKYGVERANDLPSPGIHGPSRLHTAHDSFNIYRLSLTEADTEIIFAPFTDEIERIELVNVDLESGLEFVEMFPSLQVLALRGMDLKAEWIPSLASCPSLKMVICESVKGVDAPDFECLSETGIQVTMLDSWLQWDQFENSLTYMRENVPPDGEWPAPFHSTGWATSDNGKVSIQIHARANPQLGLELIVTLRNESDSELVLPCPFAPVLPKLPELVGPDGAIASTMDFSDMPFLSYTASARYDYVFLQPNTERHYSMSLPFEYWPGSDEPGEYTLSYTFTSEDARPRDVKVTSLHASRLGHRIVTVDDVREFDLWIGEIQAPPITIERE